MTLEELEMERKKKEMEDDKGETANYRNINRSWRYTVFGITPGPEEEGGLIYCWEMHHNELFPQHVSLFWTWRKRQSMSACMPVSVMGSEHSFMLFLDRHEAGWRMVFNQIASKEIPRGLQRVADQTSISAV